MKYLYLPVTVAICIVSVVDSQAEDLGIRAPDGFEVTLYAGDDLAHDIYSMTIDSHGRIVVAGAGYVKTLHDDDGDGRADRATLFSSLPKSGAHGMVFVGDDLLCTGDDSLMRLRDTDSDGAADREPEILAKLRHPEHGANGLIQGPDGWIYLICGNDAGVTEKLATTDGSPVKQPNCGAVVRFSPDGTQSEIVAHGFRNPYDIAFNADGRMFTVDADGERDQHLPWYTPTRLFDIAQGMHHGWILSGWQRAWNRPPWIFDNVERLVEVGRGSPTGVEVYRHRQFPEHYRGGVLSCCWTLGRVYHFPLTPSGSSYSSTREVFLETTGEVGFAPVDLAVGPEGDLFVAIGGRRTRGSVFRVRYAAGVAEASGRPSTPLDQILAADQPLAAWSRAQWEPVAATLHPTELVEAAADNNRPVAQRMRAVEVLLQVFDDLNPIDARPIIDADQPLVTARVVWALGRQSATPQSSELLAELTHSKDLNVQRAVWETLQCRQLSVEAQQHVNWNALSLSTEHRVRSAAALAHVAQGLITFRPIGQRPADQLAALGVVHFQGDLRAEHFAIAWRAFRDLTSDDEARLYAVRLMQLALGDVLPSSEQPNQFAGYSMNNQNGNDDVTDQQIGILAAAFPTQTRVLNLELARLLGMLQAEDEELVSRVAGLLKDESDPSDDLHYLFVLAQLRGERSEEATSRMARAQLQLHSKMRQDQRYPSRNWPLRVGEAFVELYRRDDHLATAVIAAEEFALPEHALFANNLPDALRPAAARTLIDRVNAADEEDSWTVELVNLAATLPPVEACELLRPQWDDYRVRDAIALVLAREPQADDRSRLLEALTSPQPNVVEAVAKALVHLPAGDSAVDLVPVVVALRRACAAPEQKSVRESLTRLVAQWTGQSFSVEETRDPQTSYQPWFAWFDRTYPVVAKRVSGLTGGDATAWVERLAGVDWTAGDPTRGKRVFEKQACQRCHADTSKLGPDLAAAAGRFSRDDLFAAIIDPNKEVAPLYQTTQIVTGSGRVFHGLIVYESPDGTLLQTTPDETIRIAGDEVVSMQPSTRSLMPIGLLNGLQDADLADLYAYLRTLRAAKQ